MDDDIDVFESEPELPPLRPPLMLICADDPEPPESVDRTLSPLYSQVKGGPETGIGLGFARPIVPGRAAALRTVPKSQRSSGSVCPTLY